MVIRMAEKYLDVALFPIPGMVCFPYCSVPLHVFEPRYRAMVEDSIKHEPVSYTHLTLPTSG